MIYTLRCNRYLKDNCHVAFGNVTYNLIIVVGQVAEQPLPDN